MEDLAEGVHMETMNRRHQAEYLEVLLSKELEHQGGTTIDAQQLADVRDVTTKEILYHSYGLEAHSSFRLRVFGYYRSEC